VFPFLPQIFRCNSNSRSKMIAVEQEWHSNKGSRRAVQGRFEHGWLLQGSPRQTATRLVCHGWRFPLRAGPISQAYHGNDQPGLWRGRSDHIASVPRYGHGLRFRLRSEREAVHGCGACASVCTYGAIEMRETKQGRKATMNPVLCKGDVTAT